MRIAVLGGGHGAYAAAADLGQQGHEVALWRRDAAALAPLAESLRIGADGLLRSIGQQERDIDRIEAQYIGLVAFRGQGVDALRESYALAGDQDARGESPFQGVRPLAGLYMTDLLQGMIDLGHPLATVSINGGWVEIDSIRDLQIAELLIAEGRLDPVHL